MSTSARTKSFARRPVVLLVAAFLGLGAVGATAGAALGAVGAASAGPSAGHDHHNDADGPRFPRAGR